jgi:hypothetical protein
LAEKAGAPLPHSAAAQVEHNNLGRKHQEMDAAIPPKIAIVQQVVNQSENLCFFLAQIALSEV